MEKNIKLFPWYRMFGFDLLFYYAISVLFMTITKGLSLTQFALLSTVYAAGSIVSQLPASIIVDRLGYRKSLIGGSLCCFLGMIIYIVSDTFYLFLISEILFGLGFALKGVAETPYICACLKKIDKSEDLAKVQSKGSSMYFVFEAVASIASGYLFSINTYLPPIFCSLCCLISAIILLYFKKEPAIQDKTTIKDYFDTTFNSFKYIFKSSRLKALLVYSSLMYGTLSICVIFMKAIFKNLDVSASGFGYIYAILGIAASIGSSVEAKFEKRHRRRTLSTTLILYLTFLAIAGISNLLPINSGILITISLICFVCQNYIKGAYRVIIIEYVSRYASNRIRPKIMSMYFLAENLGYVILSSAVALLLDNFSLGISIVISTLMLFAASILVLLFMENKVGLSPDSYASKDRLENV